jgi:hypothetical protein
MRISRIDSRSVHNIGTALWTSQVFELDRFSSENYCYWRDGSMSVRFGFIVCLSTLFASRLFRLQIICDCYF